MAVLMGVLLPVGAVVVVLMAALLQHQVRSQVQVQQGRMVARAQVVQVVALKVSREQQVQ